MSGLINSFLIEPVVRHARQFSFSGRGEGDPGGEQSHASAAGATGHETFIPGAADGPNTRRQINDPYNASTSSQTDRRAARSPSEGYHGSQTGPDEDASMSSSLDPLYNAQDNLALNRLPSSSTPHVGSVPPLERHMSAPEQIRGMERSTLDGLNAMSIDDNAERHAVGIPGGMGGMSETTSLHSNRSTSSVDVASRGLQSEQRSNRSRHGSSAATRLPEDDGMRTLREQIHQIRDMALSSEEKARRMHALMVSDYRAFRANSTTPDLSQYQTDERKPVVAVKSRRSSSAAARPGNALAMTISSGSMPEESFSNVTEKDRLPTHWHKRSGSQTLNVPEPGASSDEEDTSRLFGCMHYKRNVKIQCPDCRRWYTCRHCHDEVEQHRLNRKRIQNMLCMICGRAQAAGEYCESCGELTASYYCNICKLWDDDTTRNIYHCPDCGICRLGQGLGKDFVHCKRCNVCISIAHVEGHRCVERATECDCPICGDWMFTSSKSVVAMVCGHYIHRSCYDAYMQRSYKCPICNRSAVNMELQWRKLDLAIDAQPMPSQFAKTRVWISCNDCAARSCTSYHWLGNKCAICDSYNTNQMKLVNSPTDDELAAIASSREVQALRAAEQNIAAAANSPDDPSSPQPPGSAPDIEDGLATPIATPASLAMSGALPAPSDPGPSSPSLTTRQIHAEAELHAPHSPTGTSITAVDSPRSQTLGSRHSRERSIDSIEMIDAPSSNQDPSNNDDEEEDEDDVAFWGEGISPGSWGISPMSGWTSPSFFATRVRAEANRGEQDEDDEEAGSEESDDDAEEGEAEMVDWEDDEVEEIDLLGHR